MVDIDTHTPNLVNMLRSTKTTEEQPLDMIVRAGGFLIRLDELLRIAADELEFAQRKAAEGISKDDPAMIAEMRKGHSA